MSLNSAALLALVAAIGLLASSAVQAAPSFRLCIPSSTADAQQACTDFLQNNAGFSSGSRSCVLGGSATGCLQKIKNGEADIISVGGDELYLSYISFGLEAVIGAEQLGAGVSYYPVAVVNRNSPACNKPKGQGLKGLNLCSTGYRKTAGWVISAGGLIAMGTIPVVDALGDVTNDAESVSNFFNKVCAPRTTSQGPRFTGSTGARWDPLCESCAGDCGATVATEPYADYEGAFRCLTEGAGDVAFVKHSTVLDYALSGPKALPWGVKPKEDFQLLCPTTGNCVDVDNWAGCNFGKAAANAFVSRQGWADAMGSSGYDTVAEMVTLAGSSTWRANALAMGTSIGVKNFPFHSDTRGLSKVTVEFIDYFGVEPFAAYEKIRSLPVPVARFCTTTRDEQDFCLGTLSILNSRNLGVNFGCVQRSTDHECMAAIRDGQAEMRTLDAVDIYDAIDYDLKAIVGEDYGNGLLEYYSVGAVKKSFCDSTPQANRWAALKGKGSCHTGYRKTAGWVMPVGKLVDMGVVPVTAKEGSVKNDAETMANYFGGVCAPRTADNGPVETADGVGALWDPLCSICNGAGTAKCSNSDPYYDYEGSFRCLAEGGGQVAFFKHTTINDYVGKGNFAGYTRDDFQLLCPDGSCVSESQYRSCNFAKVPAHAVVVSAQNENMVAVTSALVAAGEIAEFKSRVFTSTNTKSWLFKGSTKALQAIECMDTTTYLGNAWAAIRGFEKAVLDAPPLAVAKRGVSGGAAAGIAIGACVGGVLIAAAASVVYLRATRKDDKFGKYATDGATNGGTQA